MILLVDNYDSFTWNLVQRLGELDPSLDPDASLRVLRNDEITAEEALRIDDGGPPSHCIISPGPCTPREAGNSSDIIHALSGLCPVLGVCLGHQCMADRDGMTVERHPIPMHGKTSLIHHDARGIFAGLSNPFEATRYHSLAVRPDTIPALPRDPQGRPLADGWEVSAWATETDGTRVVQGLRRVWLDPSRTPVEGVQFHPESFMTLEGPRLLANFLAMGSRGRRIADAAIAAVGR